MKSKYVCSLTKFGNQTIYILKPSPSFTKLKNFICSKCKRVHTTQKPRKHRLFLHVYNHLFYCKNDVLYREVSLEKYKIVFILNPQKRKTSKIKIVSAHHKNTPYYELHYTLFPNEVLVFIHKRPKKPRCRNNNDIFKDPKLKLALQLAKMIK